jgi:hypothetical protein
MSRLAGDQMDSLGDNEIARLLRLKRYEKPPPDYFENFLHEFRRRQRDALRHQPLWSVCLGRTQDLVFRYNIRPLVSYATGLAVAAACVAVISITVHQQPEPVQVAVESSPVPRTRPASADRKFNLAPPVLNATFDMQPTLLPETGDVHVLPADLRDSFRSDEFVPLNLQWKSLDDQSMRPGSPP